MTTTFRIFDVGGFVRDALLGVPSKDRDCSVVIEGAPADLTVEAGFALLREHLVGEGFRIFVETPEHATIRALPPVRGDLTADFVLARKDGPSSDGRRPDFVTVGTLADDLDRRDFTVNALARDCVTGELHDRHDGVADLDARILRFVGDPMARIHEDSLRVMRALRFHVTRGFAFHESVLDALHSPEVPALLARVSEERREAELRSMFARAGTVAVLDLLGTLPRELVEAIFTGRVRLTSTLKGG